MPTTSTWFPAIYLEIVQARASAGRPVTCEDTRKPSSARCKDPMVFDYAHTLLTSRNQTISRHWSSKGYLSEVSSGSDAVTNARTAQRMLDSSTYTHLHTHITVRMCIRMLWRATFVIACRAYCLCTHATLGPQTVQPAVRVS